MPEPKRRAGGLAGWQALSLKEAARGREKGKEGKEGGPGTAARRDLTHTEPQHRLYSAALAGLRWKLVSM